MGFGLDEWHKKSTVQEKVAAILAPYNFNKCLRGGAVMTNGDFGQMRGLGQTTCISIKVGGLVGVHF